MVFGGHRRGRRYQPHRRCGALNAFGSNGVLSLSGGTGESAKAVALHVKDERNVATDIMTEFTPVGPGEQQDTHLTCPDDRHPHMIDLGLPSGTLWSCCNEGAHTPADYGDHYAWGETKTKKPTTAIKAIFMAISQHGKYYYNGWAQHRRHPIRCGFRDVAFMRVMPTSKQLQEPVTGRNFSEGRLICFKYDKPVYGLRLIGKTERPSSCLLLLL